MTENKWNFLNAYYKLCMNCENLSKKDVCKISKEKKRGNDWCKNFKRKP